MRRVKVFKAGRNAAGDREELGEGFFHKWGIESVETNDGVVTYSVAIVEMENGSIMTVPPGDVQFIDSNNKEKPVLTINTNNEVEFLNFCNASIKQGYKLLSSSCGFLNSEYYDFRSSWQAVLVKG